MLEHQPKKVLGVEATWCRWREELFDVTSVGARLLCLAITLNTTVQKLLMLQHKTFQLWRDTTVDKKCGMEERRRAKHVKF